MSPLPAGPYPPNNELVGRTWLSTKVPGLTAAIVGMALPQDTTKWADTGFLQLRAIPGGRSPDIDVPLRLPILQLDGWATSNPSRTSTSTKPQWMLANRILELVRLGVESMEHGQVLELPGEYTNVRVQSAYLISEIERVTDDPSGYARFTTDLAIDWVPA